MGPNWSRNVGSNRAPNRAPHGALKGPLIGPLDSNQSIQSILIGINPINSID